MNLSFLDLLSATFVAVVYLYVISPIETSVEESREGLDVLTIRILDPLMAEAERNPTVALIDAPLGARLSIDGDAWESWREGSSADGRVIWSATGGQITAFVRGGIPDGVRLDLMTLDIPIRSYTPPENIVERLAADRLSDPLTVSVETSKCVIPPTELEAGALWRVSINLEC